ncbi:hypothetical protein GOV14_00025 [Candidatus Pacearchaeota archaeon]|nr:hypothetical protein [Candidatus Pacearchaeota archaeon]
METYTQKYLVTRLMHMRPCMELHDYIINSKKEAQGIEYKLCKDSEEIPINCDSILELTLYGSDLKGQHAIITTTGNFEKKTLKYYNNELGKIFRKADD